jgi:hypothetical protein
MSEEEDKVIVYVAAPSARHRVERAKRMMAAIEMIGGKIALDWTKDTDQEHAGRIFTEEELRQLALRDIRAATEADVVVLLTHEAVNHVQPLIEAVHEVGDARIRVGGSHMMGNAERNAAEAGLAHRIDQLMYRVNSTPIHYMEGSRRSSDGALIELGAVLSMRHQAAGPLVVVAGPIPHPLFGLLADQRFDTDAEALAWLTGFIASVEPKTGRGPTLQSIAERINAVAAELAELKERHERARLDAAALKERVRLIDEALTDGK